MPKALKDWPVELINPGIPRIYQIIKEIDRRFRNDVMALTGDTQIVERTAIIQNGVIRNYYVIAPYILCGLMDATCGMVRGLGRAWLPMLVSLTGACLLRIVWIWTLFRWTHTLEMLYISYPISWIVTAAVHAVCYFVIWKKLRARLEQAAPQTEQA